MNQSSPEYFNTVKRTLIIVKLLFFFMVANSQKRLVSDNALMETIRIVERDYPGYFILTNERKNEYEKVKENIIRQSRNASEFEINILTNEYLNFFNDNHLISIYFKNNYTDNTPINIFIENQRQLKKIPSGLWLIRSFDIVVQIKKKANLVYGYIYKDLNGFSKKGSRYLVVYPAIKRNSYNFLFISEDGFSFSETVEYKNGQFYTGKDRVFMEPISQVNIAKVKPIFKADQSPVFRRRNESVFEINFPSLSTEYQAITDSLLLANDSFIRKSKTLIIDLRGNGGGSVLPTLGLIKYIKTGPIHYINSYSIASDSLIENVKSSCANRDTLYPNYYNNYCNKFLPILLANRGKMVFDSSELYDSPEPQLLNPQNVAILIDNMTTSAAELFVLAARQSKKVKIFGENSAGVVDFGGVTTYFLKPSGHALYLTTEMAEYIHKKQYDGVGISPDIKLFPPKDNWLYEIVRYYDKK